MTTLVTNKFIIHLIPTKYTTYTYLLLLTIHSHFINLIPGHIYTIHPHYNQLKESITFTFTYRIFLWTSVIHIQRPIFNPKDKPKTTPKDIGPFPWITTTSLPQPLHYHFIQCLSSDILSIRRPKQ